MSSLNYPPVARMNATRTTPPYHPAQVEEEQKSTTNPTKLTACEITCIAYMAAGIFEMIAETRNNLRIGDRLLITLIEEKNGYTKKRTRRCRVTGKYRRVFTVQPGPCVMSFKYADLLIGDGVEYDKKRKST